MKIYSVLNPDYISNIFLIADEINKTGILINPGSFALNVYKLVKSTEVEIKKIIITENKKENINGIPMLKKIYDPEIFAYNENIFNYKINKIREGTIIKEGEIELRIIETPINTFDAISILINNIIFVGDIMQAGTLSSFEEKRHPTNYEFDILKKKILSLDDSLIIFPGHGPATTLEIEKQFNPYINKFIKEQ